MATNKIFLGLLLAAIVLSGCSRQQSDWQKAREANTSDSYEQFLKKYPSGEFTAQAQARVKELYEERDWQKARDTDTAEAYQAFLKQYPAGKWSEEARIRIENFTLAQAPAGATGTATGPADSNVAAGAAGAAAAVGAAAGAAAGGAAASGPASSAPGGTNKTAATATTGTVRRPAAAVSKHKAAAGTYGIQLGAFKSGAGAAHKHWAQLKQQYAQLLSGVSSKVAPKKSAAGTVYRLQASGLSEARARAICKTLKAKSQACVLIPPAKS